MNQKKSQFEENYQLPESYGITNLTMIARDPHWIHAYWEVNQESLEQVKSQMGNRFDNGVFVLRMYDVTLIAFNGSNANHTFDIEVGWAAKNWYVNLWDDNVTYCGEIGIRSQDGSFYSFVRSNFVTTQRKSLSPRRDMVWMEVQEGKPVDTFVKEDLILADRKRARRRLWYITEEDIKSFYANLVPMLRRRIRPSRKLNRKALLNRENNLSGVSQSLEKSISCDQLSIFGMTEEQIKKIFLGASAEMQMLEKGGASEQLFGLNAGASEQLVLEKGRKFFFEIGTELIVYGRTEPDATVELCGQKVKLREDGTFTMRFALPDGGNIPLDFQATSADKVETRKIVTAGLRTKTMYSP